MIKAIIFDLDDTLILERDYIKSGFDVVSKKISKDFQMDEVEIRKNLDYFFRISPKNVFNRALDICGICYCDQYIKELIYEFRNHQPKIQLIDDAIHILECLISKGYKLGIITDGFKETQRKKIEALNITDLFEYILVTDEIGREYWKPHERPYRLMREKLGIDFHEMIYVGDNVLKDFVTARRLGIKTIQIKRNGSVYDNINCSEAYLPHAMINNLTELSNLLSVM